MIYLEDPNMNPAELFEPNNEFPPKFTLRMLDEKAQCEKVAKEYANSMRRPKYYPLYEMTCAKVNVEERKLFAALWHYLPIQSPASRKPCPGAKGLHPSHGRLSRQSEERRRPLSD